MDTEKDPSISPSATTPGEKKKRQIAGRGIALLVFGLLVAFVLLYLLIAGVFIAHA